MHRLPFPNCHAPVACCDVSHSAPALIVSTACRATSALRHNRLASLCGHACAVFRVFEPESVSTLQCVCIMMQQVPSSDLSMPTLCLIAAVETLRAGLHDDHERVRRRAMLTLGELIFYLCSVEPPSRSGGRSEARDTASADATVDAVLRLLRPEEDPVAQHYACKTIDNVVAKHGFWPERFAVMGTARALLDVCPPPLICESDV